MRPMFSFLAQLLLFSCCMLVSQSRFDDDDELVENVHLRIIITSFQVIVLQFFLSVFILTKFVISVVKRDRHKFVIVDLPTKDENLRVGSSVDNPELQTDGSKLLDAAETALSKVEEISLHESDSVHSFFEPVSIVFETSSHLDMYVLYINVVGLVMWQTMLSFDFELYNAYLLFLVGMVAGWFWSFLFIQKQAHAQINRLHVCTYMCAIGIICGISCSGWRENPEANSLSNLTLCIATFWSGMFWTAVSSNIAFQGDRFHSQGITHDSRRAIPTFLLVMSIATLYSTPNTRTDLFIYVKSLSRMASVHLFLVQPLSKFICAYVTILALERQQVTNVTIALVVTQGLSFFKLQPNYDALGISALIVSVLLTTIHATWMARIKTAT